MTLAQAEKILVKWQKRLRLQDWEIILTVNREMGDGIWGRCSVWKNKLRADVEIAPAGFLQEDPISPPMDELIAHELLHIVLAAQEMGIKHDDDDPAHKHYERGIDRIAKALVEGFENGSK